MKRGLICTQLKNSVFAKKLRKIIEFMISTQYKFIKLLLIYFHTDTFYPVFFKNINIFI